jgi:hypothetical protein
MRGAMAVSDLKRYLASHVAGKKSDIRAMLSVANSASICLQHMLNNVRTISCFSGNMKLVSGFHVGIVEDYTNGTGLHCIVSFPEVCRGWLLPASHHNDMYITINFPYCQSLGVGISLWPF